SMASLMILSGLLDRIEPNPRTEPNILTEKTEPEPNQLKPRKFKNRNWNLFLLSREPKTENRNPKQEVEPQTGTGTPNRNWNLFLLSREPRTAPFFQRSGSPIFSIKIRNKKVF